MFDKVLNTPLGLICLRNKAATVDEIIQTFDSNEKIIRIKD